MKHFYAIFPVIVCLLFSNFLMCAKGTFEPYNIDNQVHNSFKELETTIFNSGQGWMNSTRFPCSITYLRISWSELEPGRGKYDWTVIENAIASSRKKNARISLRIMTCNAHSSGYYTSPKWLFDEGCKGYEYLKGGANDPSGGALIPRIEPEYSDPIYISRHAEFISALGEKYNNSPYIEFLDIGSYGVWGEWHTDHPASIEIRKKIVDMYRQAFPNKQLVFMTDDAEVLRYALENKIGMRRDGVGSPWHESNWIGSAKYVAVSRMADAWKIAPIVFEWYGDYSYLISKGWSFESAINFMLNNHVTIINDNIGNVPQDKMPLLNKIARLAGARLVLNDLSHNKKVTTDSLLEVKMRWSNTGVGKIYNHYVLRFHLLNSKNQVVMSQDSKIDLRDWLPGTINFTESITIPSAIKKGDYELAIALVDPKGELPAFNLAFDAP